MKTVTIIGANGQIAQRVIKNLKNDSRFTLKLFVRTPEKLIEKNDNIYVGDATNLADVKRAIAGSDIVYANLGPLGMDQMVGPIIEAMHQENVEKLVWISTLGVYNEVEKSLAAVAQLEESGFMSQNKTVVAEIEKSDLDYTIIRPNWFSYDEYIDYKIFDKGETVPGSKVTTASITDLVEKVLKDDSFEYRRRSLGISEVHN